MEIVHWATSVDMGEVLGQGPVHQHTQPFFMATTIIPFDLSRRLLSSLLTGRTST